MPGQGPLVTASFQRHAKAFYAQPATLSTHLPFRVCVRKRPLFEYETAAGAYDTVQTNTSLRPNILSDGRERTCHNFT